MQLSEIEVKEFQSLDFKALESLQSKKDLWLKQRLGKFTASEVHRLMTSEDSPTLSKGAQTYVREKVVETLTGIPKACFTSEAIVWGNQIESKAIAYFEAKTDKKFSYTGDDQKFIALDFFGATPDGINQMEGIEVKCPNSTTHLHYLENIKNQDDLKRVKPEYYWQIMLCMLVTGLEKFYFISFDPRFKDEHLKMLAVLVVRDELAIDRMLTKLNLANVLKNKIIQELKNK